IPCSPIWASAPTGGAILGSSAAVANGVVYVGSDDHQLYAYPASCSTPCSPLWAGAPTGGAIRSAPAAADGVVYVGSFDGSLYAFDLSSVPLRPARPDPSALRPTLGR